MPLADEDGNILTTEDGDPLLMESESGVTTMNANSNRGSILVSDETTWGEDPGTPTMLVTRFTGESLKHKKQTVESAEIVSDRNVSDVVQVGWNAEGSLNGELVYGAYDKFIQSALYSTFSTFTYTSAGASGDLNFDSSAQTITGPAATWTGLVPGQWVRIDNLANGSGNAATNNIGIKQIALDWNSSATVLKLVAGSIGTTQTGKLARVRGKMIRNAVTQKSLLIEKRFSDVTQFVSYRGMIANTMAVDITSKQIAKISFTFLGKKGVRAGASVATTVTAANTNKSMNATTNVGTIVEDGVTLTTALKSVKFTVNNSLVEEDAIGPLPTVGVTAGDAKVIGNIDAYFKDETLYEKYVTHEESALVIPLTDIAGNSMIFSFPRTTYPDGNVELPSKNQPVMVPLQFQSVKDATLACSIQIDCLDI